MDLLPSDIVRSILYFVSPSDLGNNAYRVCKRWLALLKDDRFWVNYFNGEPNPIKHSWLMYASCRVPILDKIPRLEFHRKYILGKINLSYWGTYYGRLYCQDNHYMMQGDGYLEALNGNEYKGQFRYNCLDRGTITFPNGDRLEIFKSFDLVYSNPGRTVDYGRYEHTCTIEDSNGYPIQHRYIEYGSYHLCPDSPDRFHRYNTPIYPTLRYGKRFYSDGRTMLKRPKSDKIIYTWPDGSVYRGKLSSLIGTPGSDVGSRFGDSTMRWSDGTRRKGFWSNDGIIGDDTNGTRRWDGFFLLSEADQYRKVKEEMAKLKAQ